MTCSPSQQKPFNSMATTLPGSKRVRVSKGQSKYGCYTCRGRKVKCDEQKPFCRRCRHAKLECEGYPVGAGLDPGSLKPVQMTQKGLDLDIIPITRQSKHNNNTQIITVGPADKERLVAAGLNLLLNSYSDEHAVGLATLKSLVNKHVSSSMSVKAACAALGAVSEMQEQPEHRPTGLNLVLEKQYGEAIVLVRQEIEGLSPRSNAILTACIVLTAVETMVRRKQDALMHLRGAYQALSMHTFLLARNAQDKLVCNLKDPSVLESKPPEAEAIDTDMLLRIFDVQTLLFTTCARPPAMQPHTLEALKLSLGTAHVSNSVDKQTIDILHASLGHLHLLSRDSAVDTHSDTSELQMVHYSRILHLWISTLSRYIAETDPQAERCRLLILRNLCLSVAIQMGAAFAGSESVHDRYVLWYEDIVASSEEIMKCHCEQRKSQTPKLQFAGTSQLGLLQPLYMAALKCHDHEWRQRAIRCLSKSEREGPWIGRALAAISQRVVDIEEFLATTTNPQAADAPKIDSCKKSTNSSRVALPAHARISHIIMVEQNGAVNGDLWPSADSGILGLKLFRRRQPATLLPTLVKASNYFCRLVTNEVYTRSKHFDPDTWDEWREQIRFGPDIDLYEVLSSNVPSIGVG